VNSWPEDVQKDCRFFLGDSLEQGVERLQALVEVWRYGKGLMEARYPEMFPNYPEMFPKSVSASSAPEQENKGGDMAVTECRSDHTKGDEMSQGMTTERVTLEITQFNNGGYKPASEWDWEFFLRGEALTDGESVRVVEDFVSSVDERTYVDTFACDEERDFANRILDERDAAIRERESLREQLESVACRAATAETALAEIKSLDYTRAAVNGAAWQANNIAAKALEAASVGNRPETPVSSTQAASGGEGLTPHQWSVVQHLIDAAEDAGEFAVDAFSVNERAVKLRSAIGAARRLLTDPLPSQAASGNSQAILDGSQAASGGGEDTVTEGDCLATVKDEGGRPMPKGPAPGLVAKQAATGGGEQPRGWLTEEERDAVTIAAEQAPESDFVTNEEGRRLRAVLTALLARSSLPPQPRGWLTEKERGSIQHAATCAKSIWYYSLAQELENILARSSPPEVVKPCWWKSVNPLPGYPSWQPFMDQVTANRDKEWIAALAAIGVAVKEVPRE
jgi:hypothetical protein